MKRPDSRRLTLVALTIRVCPLLFAPARPFRRPPSEPEPSIRITPKPPVNRDDRNRWVAPVEVMDGTGWGDGWVAPVGVEAAKPITGVVGQFTEGDSLASRLGLVGWSAWKNVRFCSFVTS